MTHITNWHDLQTLSQRTAESIYAIDISEQIPDGTNIEAIFAKISIRSNCKNALFMVNCLISLV